MRPDTLAMLEKQTQTKTIAAALAPYECETRAFRVAVKPAYLDDQSDPSEERYVWSYTVTIANKGPESVQLISRYWNIMDAAGRVQEVRGPGVVGAQLGPRFGPPI